MINYLLFYLSLNFTITCFYIYNNHVIKKEKVEKIYYLSYSLGFLFSIPAILTFYIYGIVKRND